MAGSVLFAGVLALFRGAGAAYVEYTTYQNDDCVNVISTSVYAGVPRMAGVQPTDTCMDFEEISLTSIGGFESFQHECNITSGQLTLTVYMTDDCDIANSVSGSDDEDLCQVSCTADEPDFGSDEFQDATVAFYDSSACTTATDTEVYTGADLYELFGAQTGTPCSPSGEFDYNTVIHCSDGSPAAVYYEDNACTGGIVGMTFNVGCAPVPADGTYPGGWFMAECSEGTVALGDDDAAEDAGNGATSSLVFGLSFGVGATSIATVLSTFVLPM